MALFFGGVSQLHRQLKGLLLPGLPRGQISTREAGGRGTHLLLLPLDLPL